MEKWLEEMTGDLFSIKIVLIVMFIILLILFGLLLYNVIIGVINSSKIKIFLDDEKHDTKILEFNCLKFRKMAYELKDVFRKNDPKIIDANEIFDYRIFISHGTESFCRSLINSFTGLGLLGTFLGLKNSISKIDYSASSNAIGSIVNALKGAFGTSILGVCLSIIFSILLAIVIWYFREKTFKLASQLMSIKKSTNPDYFYNDYLTMSSEKYTHGMEIIVSKFLEGIEKELTGDLQEYKKALKESTDELVKSNNDFTESFESQKIIMEDLKNYLDRIDAKIKEYENYMKEITDGFDTNMEKIKDGMDNVRLSFNEIAQANKNYHDSIIEINNHGLDSNKKVLELLQKELKDVEQEFESVKVVTSDFTSNMINTPEQFKNAMEDFSSSFSNKLDSILDKLEKFQIVEEKEIEQGE